MTQISFPEISANEPKDKPLSREEVKAMLVRVKEMETEINALQAAENAARLKAPF